MALLGWLARSISETKPHRRLAQTRVLSGMVALGLVFLAGHALGSVPSARAADAVVFEREVVLLINQLRAQEGLAHLEADARLFEAARSHSAWMFQERRLSHRGESNSGPGDRALAAGYDFTHLGEVLAQGQGSPLEVVYGRGCDRYCQTECDASNRCDGWRQSPAHWEILSKSEYREIGVGYHNGDGRFQHWWALTAGAAIGGVVPLDGTPTPSPMLPSATATQTTQATPVATTMPTSTATQTQEPGPERSPTPTVTPAATRTIEPLPSASPTTTASPTQRVLPSPTRTATATLAASSPSPAPTQTQTPSPTLEAPTSTPTVTPSPAQPSHIEIRGSVSVAEGSEQAGTHLILSGQPIGVTDAQGRFAIDTQLEGPHVLVAIRPGYLSRQASLQLDLDAGAPVVLPAVELTAGDLRIDGRVDLDDLRVLAAVFDVCKGSARFNPVIDFDGSGCIGWEDYRLVASNFDKIGPERWEPEPEAKAKASSD